MAVRTRTRYMDGIASRLDAHHDGRQHKTDTPIEVPYRRASTIDLDAALGTTAGTNGSVRLWRTVVLNPKESKPAREFAPGGQAEMWTLNGQTHNARSDRHFGSKKVGLDALRGHLVVEVELDELSPDAKSLVVTTARNNRARRQLGAKIEDAIDQVLRDDDRLKELNQEIREEAFRKASSQRIAGLDKALRAFGLLVKRKREITVDGPEKEDALEPITAKAPDPISPLHDHPQEIFQFRTTLRSRIRVERGHTSSVLLEADAVDGYFDGSGTILSLQLVPDLGEKLRVVSRDSLEGGRMRVHMRATKDAPLVETQLIASCLPPDAAAPLTASIPVEIIEDGARRKNGDRRKNKKEKKEVEEDAPPDVVVAYREDPEYSWAGLSLDWTVETVGEYKNGIAYVNGDFADLAKLRDELPKQRHNDITNLYVAPVGMTLVGLKESEENPPKDSDDKDIDLHEHYRNAALQSAALSSLFAIRYMNDKTTLLGSSDDED